MALEVTLNIRKLAFGGEGVGEVVESPGNDSLLGIATFVPFTIPGEKVVASLTEQKKNYARGSLLQILKSSESRVAPLCEYFTDCGGCELQHIKYDEQLALKTEMIRGALHAGKLPGSVVEKVQLTIPSTPYSYRRRVTLHLSEAGAVGFYREKSRSIVAIERCVVARDEISILLPGIKNFGKIVAGKISSITLESDARGVVAVLKCTFAPAKKEQEYILSAAREIFESAVLLNGAESIAGYGREILELPLNAAGTLMLQVPAGNFSQVNSDINRQLVEYVFAVAEVEKASHVLDLYAGAGNFSLPLAKNGAKVVAVEIDKRLVQIGRQNAERYKFTRNLHFVESSVEKFLNSSNERRDIIVADPPRNGLGALASKLSGTSKLILISCHLPSCVRDLAALTSNGFQVQEIQPFDMFAQTTYTEIVSILTSSRSA